MFRSAVGVVLLIAFALTAFQTYREQSQLAAVTTCQTAANQQFVLSLARLGDANDALDSATLAFLDSRRGTQSQAQRDAAFDAYENAVRARATTRAQNPLVVQDCSQAGG